MRILLTGATGYIAQRLLPVLLHEGHEVICCVRDKNRFNSLKYPAGNLSVAEVEKITDRNAENFFSIGGSKRSGKSWKFRKLEQ